MTKHYTEAELLETYYTQPGESMPVMMHLAACSGCAARYERLEAKLRGLAACDIDAKPQTFWTRQRMLIMRGIDAGKQRGVTVARTWRVAAAAVLVFILGGTVVYETVDAPKPAAQTETVVQIQQPKVSAEDSVVHDAWQSDELRDFHGMVQWETWDDAKTQARAKGSSL
jgi:anti-sigma factor ChrR (cupin superfamily)